jgi:hypothetical protein
VRRSVAAAEDRACRLQTLHEVIARYPHPLVEVEAVGVLALGDHRGVQVELAAAEPARLLLAPVEQRRSVAAPPRLRERREVVDVDGVAREQRPQHAEAGHGHDSPVLEDADDPVALRTLLLVHTADELGLVRVVRAERAHRLEGERRLPRRDLPWLAHCGSTRLGRVRTDA